jgi:hypothetical protein
MKTVIILYMLVLLASAASAEIYRWEDANGVNFTDDYSSVPEKFREKFFAEADAQPENTSPSQSTAPPVKVGMYRQYNPDAFQESKAAVLLANLEQKRSIAEAVKQKQIRTRDFQNTLQSLAFYIEIVVLLGIVLFVIWVATIADIVRSEFIIPSNKTVWLLLVLLLPLIGMLPYMILGANHKCNPVSHNEVHRPVQLAVLSTGDSSSKGFVI